jgi:2-oxoglutarate dehydrogenase E2 component (dihydrolipoamide succinyltransferase)
MRPVATEAKAEDKGADKPKETAESAAPAKEKGDKTEPADQQVDKEAPAAPPPTDSQKHRPAPPALDKGSNAAPKKETTDAAPKAKSEPAPKPTPAPGARGETRVKMNRMRLRIAERLKESQNAAASLTTFNEIDMSALMALRKKYKDDVLKTHDVKLGFMSAFARACCLALKEIPVANASIDVRAGVLALVLGADCLHRVTRLYTGTTSTSASRSPRPRAS